MRTLAWKQKFLKKSKTDAKWKEKKEKKNNILQDFNVGNKIMQKLLQNSLKISDPWKSFVWVKLRQGCGDGVCVGCDTLPPLA